MFPEKYKNWGIWLRFMDSHPELKEGLISKPLPLFKNG